MIWPVMCIEMRWTNSLFVIQSSQLGASCNLHHNNMYMLSKKKRVYNSTNSTPMDALYKRWILFAKENKFQVYSLSSSSASQCAFYLETLFHMDGCREKRERSWGGGKNTKKNVKRARLDLFEQSACNGSSQNLPWVDGWIIGKRNADE